MIACSLALRISFISSPICVSPPSVHVQPFRSYSQQPSNFGPSRFPATSWAYFKQFSYRLLFDPSQPYASNAADLCSSHTLPEHHFSYSILISESPRLLVSYCSICGPSELSSPVCYPSQSRTVFHARTSQLTLPLLYIF